MQDIYTISVRHCTLHHVVMFSRSAYVSKYAIRADIFQLSKLSQSPPPSLYQAPFLSLSLSDT